MIENNLNLAIHRKHDKHDVHVRHGKHEKKKGMMRAIKNIITEDVADG